MSEIDARQNAVLDTVLRVAVIKSAVCLGMVGSIALLAFV